MPGLMQALYDHLAAVAARGEPCPTANHLAETIGVREESIAWLLRRLVDDRRIAATFENVPAGREGGHRYRIVAILATGHRTASRKGKPAAPPDVLERAKTFLRSRGPTVYAASVAHGRSAGDLIVVDHRMLTPAQVIERAVALGFAGT